MIAFLFAMPGLAWSFVRRLTMKQVLAGVVVIGGWLLWILGQRRGRTTAETKERQRKARAVEDMKEIRDEVEALPDDARRAEFHRFVRHKDKR